MLFSKDMTADSPLRQHICDRYFTDESALLKTLLTQLQLSEAERGDIAHQAHDLIAAIRKQQSNTTIDAILNEYQLTSVEGQSLMCLAEALLRVPDKYTAFLLLEDKLTAADWRSHLKNNRSLFIRLLSSSLYLAGVLLRFRQDRNVLKRIVAWCSTPIIYKLVRRFTLRLANQFILSQTIKGALQDSESLLKRSYCFSYDMLGESARTKKDEQRYFYQYLEAIKTIGEQAKGKGPIAAPSVSVKLSALHSRYEFTQYERVRLELIPRLKQLALQAKKYDIGLTIDAEESSRLDLSLDIFEALYLDAELANWQGFGLAVQAYQARATAVIDWLIDLTKTHKRKISVRLVKGAYWDSEIKWAQEKGLSHYPVFTSKAATDVSYLVCAQKLLDAKTYLYPQFATHNAHTVCSILQMDNTEEGYEFQRLHNMGQALYDQILKKVSVPCRIYAPVGKHVDLLSYLVRRMLENGANSSFVNNLVDAGISIDDLVSDPITKVSQPLSKQTSIALPKDRFQNEFANARLNSAGIELSDKNAVNDLKLAISPIMTTQLNYLPPNANLLVHNPANLQELVGGVVVDNEKSIEHKLQLSQQAFEVWSKSDVLKRCQCLDLIADKLEQHKAELIALCIKEAGKTVADSIAEVREAVDFCRYYSRQAQLLFDQHDVVARGVVLCISPWNFPLAIFMGQVAAALVTGNTVLAKAAEKTSLVARRVIELINETDIEENAVQRIFGLGQPIGEQLVPDARIKAVMFTGSCETAVWINQTLAQREHNKVPFIAETGGQNAMIVDSTAQLDQVVDDVVQSGFYSAGQRCSSLRVLFVQQDVADQLIQLIQGAMAELTIGDPQFVDADIGPIIDQKSLERLQQHCDYLQNLTDDKAKHIFSCKLNKAVSKGYFFAPCLYEIQSLDILKGEVFGPIVHVIRYSSTALDDVIAQINHCGYGLTLGIQTRLTSTANYLADKINVGNVYINRTMVGAVVGEQPFGGRGLSGTGPKAGGPNYLQALVKSANQSQASFELPTQNKHMTAEALFIHAQTAWHVWQQTTLSERVSILKQFCSEIEKQDAARAKLSQSCRQVIENGYQKLSDPVQLSSPTGEENQLLYVSRGVIVALAHKEMDEQAWLEMFVAALTVGNVFICVLPETDFKLKQLIETCLSKSKVPQHIVQFIGDTHAFDCISHECVSAVISPSHNSQIQGELAQRKGPIIPLLCCDEPFVMNRLLLEKTITIDTTAAIGNAALLSQ